MWSAAGQWVGGIGTIIAVWMALKQINETRRLQYELLKPEIDLYASPEGVVYQAGNLFKAKQLSMDAFNLVMNSEFKIMISNTKQTPVRVTILVVDSVKYKMSTNAFYRINGRVLFRFIGRAVKRTFSKPVSNYWPSLHEVCTTNHIIQPGDEYSIRLNLSPFIEEVLQTGIVKIRFQVEYTNSQKKAIYIIIRDPALIDSSNIVVLKVIKNESDADKMFMHALWDIKKK
jgi:hypothetical protein